MKPIRRRRAALFLAASMMASAIQAQAATCPPGDATQLAVGTVAPVEPGEARIFALDLDAGEGVIIDLARIAPRASPGEDQHDEEDGSARPEAQDIRLCDTEGKVLAPQPGEVFAKGGSLSTTDDGQRLRFLATDAGRYFVAVVPDAAPREILVRRRDSGLVQAPIIAAEIGEPQRGITSSTAPMTFAFDGPAGQWVEIKSTSEKDTLLRLAAPDQTGAYSIIAENDDSDGLNPVIRRKLPVTGTYFVQVDGLADEPGEFNLSLYNIDAPRPPQPPAPLRIGTPVSGKLADNEDVAMYALAVTAGHTYRLELTAAYDGVVAIGVPSPVEPEDGGSEEDASFTEIKSQDSGTTGTEKLGFTARNTGQVLVRVRSFGIGETEGEFTLKAVDVGG